MSFINYKEQGLTPEGRGRDPDIAPPYPTNCSLSYRYDSKNRPQIQNAEPPFFVRELSGQLHFNLRQFHLPDMMAGAEETSASHSEIWCQIN